MEERCQKGHASPEEERGMGTWIMRNGKVSARPDALHREIYMTCTEKGHLDHTDPPLHVVKFHGKRILFIGIYFNNHNKLVRKASISPSFK